MVCASCAKEKKDLTDVAKHDIKVLGTALKVAIENALRDQQVADIHEILGSLNSRIRPSTSWFSIQQAGFRPTHSAVPAPRLWFRTPSRR